MINMNDILNQIIELKTDDQIWHFIINRIFKLELSSEEKTVEQNYTDSFRDYISKKYISRQLKILKNVNVQI